MAAAPETSSATVGAGTPPPLSVRSALVWALVAATCFHIAHLVPYASFAILGFFIGLLNLTRLNNSRHGFRWGIAVGWLIYMPHLAFFWNLFVPDGPVDGAKAIGVIGVLALWTVLPVWLGLFLCLATWLRRWTKPAMWILLIPACWTGIEYFRSELYPLKFSWLSAAYAFAESPWMVPLGKMGMYGVGFVLLLLATFTSWGWRKSKLGAGLVFIGMPYALLFVAIALPRNHPTKTSVATLPVAGVQLEFPSNTEALQQLDGLIAVHPETELCVLSEYAFGEPVPEVIRNWCRDNERYLIAGGRDPLGATNFYNTAFVVGPDGEIVFKQVKAVPIQFFADGLPAPRQRVWDSPWGRLGLCICYDLGYTRVTDELVELGAEAIIAPTMDVAHWGSYQHQLHSRVAPIRAAEYNIPIFRLTSSGISQHVLASGKVKASRPYPGQGEVLMAQLELRGEGCLPLDRWIAPLCVVVTGITAIIAVIMSLRRTLAQRTMSPDAPRL